MSIEERYTGRADYLTQVEQIAQRLARERYVLQRDVPAILEAAGKHWDWRVGVAQPREPR